MTEGNNISPVQALSTLRVTQNTADTRPAPVDFAGSRENDTVEITRASQAQLEQSLKLRELEVQQQSQKKAPPPLPLGDSRPSLLKSADGELIVKRYNFVTGEVSYEPGDFLIKDLITRSDVAAVAFRNTVDVQA